MRAMVLEKISSLADNEAPLRLCEWPEPVAGDGEILIRVAACGVCHTEIDEIEGRLPPPRLPVVPGHQAVGRVAALGERDSLEVLQRSGLQVGDRVGVAWINSACGHCGFCLGGLENLCPSFRATGLDAHGGYAQYMSVRADFACRLPENLSDVEAAPLLCAGAIGYRSLSLSNLQDGQTLGLTGFGASAHLVLALVRHRFPGSPVVVFARSAEERAFALERGASWAGDTRDRSPWPCAAIIDTTPVWTPVVEALNLDAGGRLVINAIRKETVDRQALLEIDYPEHLWREKEIKTVANVTRRDVREFLQLAAAIPLRPELACYPLADANRALTELRHRHVRGAKVLIID
ncbi:MAG: alcohol dehydrogenase catalytic domain-containing protein [Gammaproteobacteria bacterium]|nr:alcohol dehydrogenase catalytic domain-containing protein [Gammaproteobacteria bacterium]